MAWRKCCKWHGSTVWTLGPANSCLLLQVLGWTTVLCACCETARRKLGTWL
jgi:hypothetical protein